MCKSRLLITCLAVCTVACSGSGADHGVTNPPPPTKAAVDPAISIHLLNRLDTATARGRALYSVFALLYSPDPGNSGVALVADPNPMGQPGDGGCIAFQSDSIGARFVVLLALADTVHPTASTTATATAQAWYGGNRTLPAGWFAIATDSIDWGVSDQFTAGHGQTQADPVRWQLTWSGTGTITRVEAPGDKTCP